MSKVRMDVKSRDAKWRMTVHRLKKQLQSATQERDELSHEVIYLEQCRLNKWVTPRQLATEGGAITGATGLALGPGVARAGRRLAPRGMTFDGLGCGGDSAPGGGRDGVREWRCGPEQGTS